MKAGSTLKSRTANSLKWNLVDRVATQVLYAVTGIVLARELSQEDFGLVGALLVFQAFASLLVDSGFSYALIQRKRPTRLDYSTVLWFNIFVAVAAYALLYVSAPLIAGLFQHDMRLVPLSRVLFLALILNASAIVQTNRLMKAMDVRMVALSNSLGLILGGVAGIALAVCGYGAWAIVWQTVTIAAVKSLVLWTTSRWRPLRRFSWESLKGYFGIGSKMMATSFLNTLFVNIYSFFIGNRVGLAPLGYYTQADKWSKMGISSLSQVLTSSFLPTLSAVQDDPERFRQAVAKMNRFTSYLLFPCMLGLMCMAKPLFHTLFSEKWDASIFLFQILLLRGVFTVFTSLYSNYLLALGHGGAIVRLEIVRDAVAVIALAITFPFMSLTTADDPVYGIMIMLVGQLVASAVAWGASLWVVLRRMHASLWSFITDMLPYVAQTLLIIPLMLLGASLVEPAWAKLAVMIGVALPLYLASNAFFNSRIQRDVINYLR